MPPIAREANFVFGSVQYVCVDRAITKNRNNNGTSSFLKTNLALCHRKDVCLTVAVGVSLLLACLLSGCDGAPPAELATLSEITPRELEVGEQLTLVGSGFVVGPAELELDGSLSAPGQLLSNEQTHLSLPVLATSTTRASARLGRRHIERLGSPHITFSGKATLRFESAAGPHAPIVVATLDRVRLEFFAANVSHQAAARRAAVRGQKVLQELGITGAVLPEGRGVLIERILSSSIGAQSGLRPGEMIVAAGNVTVSSVSDLAPPPRTHHLLLGVVGIDGEFRRVSCTLERPSLSPDTDRIAAFAIGICALLFLLVAAGPFRGCVHWLGLQLVRGGRGPRELLTQVAEVGRARPIQTIVAVMLFASAPFIIMAVSHLDIVFACSLILVISIIVSITSTTGIRRLGAAITATLRTLPLVMVAAVGAVQATSMNLIDIVLGQSALPWRWNVLSDPACLLLIPLVAVTCCAGDTRRPRPASAFLRGLAGALVAAVMLGGWSAPGAQEISGQLLFAAKSWFVGLCILHAGRSRLVIALPLATCLLAGSLALHILSLPQWTSTAAAWTAGATALFLVLPMTFQLFAQKPLPERTSGVTDNPWVEKNPTIQPTLEAIRGHS